LRTTDQGGFANDPHGTRAVHVPVRGRAVSVVAEDSGDIVEFT
jgi:hypothetical protein